jgi:hypothetical protein
MKIKDKVEVVDTNSKCFGMKGIIEDINDNIVFVVLNNIQPPLPAMGSFYNYNLKVLEE